MRMQEKLFYTSYDLSDFNEKEKLGEPGEYPFTRGIHREMYRKKLWTMRQYAGFGSAEQTNKRLLFLLKHGQTGLSLAFDLPTQLGYDPDEQISEGEVGRVGVSVPTLEEMKMILKGISLDKISLSMTINATACIILSMYILLAQEKGVPLSSLRGTVQNDILKEFAARGNYIYPVRPSLRLAVDLIEYSIKNLPLWNPVSVSGYHYREAGASAVQELAFTFADGIEYVNASIKRGIDIDEIGPKISFFFSAHSNFFEEIAKFRAARRIWARIMREKFKAKNKSLLLRFHTQTAGSTLTSKEPLNNTVRVTLQSLSAVLGGTQSLHANSYDEALSLPSETSVLLSLRTQQIIAFESGICNTVDPLGGSYYIEKLTDKIEEETEKLLKIIEEKGGACACIENKFFQKEIERAAYEFQKKIEKGEIKIVGVNNFIKEGEKEQIPVFTFEKGIEEKVKERIKEYKKKRDVSRLQESLEVLKEKARTEENLVPYILSALKHRATLGEISNALRDIFGEYNEK